MQAIAVDIRSIALFVLMVFCTLSEQSVSLPLWGLNCVQCKAASAVRRFTRWLKNPKYDAATWYKPIFLYAMRNWTDAPVLLALDTTMLFDEFCAIRISMIYLGRSIPVAWRILKHGSSSVKYCEYQMLLERAYDLLPKNVPVTFLADRGFVSRRLMLHLGRLGWHWRIRVMGKQRLICGKGKVRLRELALKMGDAQFFSERISFGEGLEGLSLSVGWARSSAEPWYVLSNTPAGFGIFMDYARRFGIEEGFRDEKSGGFQLESSGIRDAKMLERLLLVVAAATIVVVSEGVFVMDSGKRDQVDPHTRRGLSYFLMGLRWIIRLIRQRAEEVYFHFELKPRGEPLMGAPSLKTARKRWKYKKPGFLFYGTVTFNPVLE